MLVDVLRKVWVGLLLNKIRGSWDKWGLINETQHGFMTGKGTHTAIPHLISLMETARHTGAPLYISSWDITRAFDSLGREMVMMALLRLHVPNRLADYMTGIDRTGRVYVRTPQNYEDHDKGGLYEHSKVLDKAIFPPHSSGRRPSTPYCVLSTSSTPTSA